MAEYATNGSYTLSGTNTRRHSNDVHSNWKSNVRRYNDRQFHDRRQIHDGRFDDRQFYVRWRYDRARTTLDDRHVPDVFRSNGVSFWFPCSCKSVEITKKWFSRKGRYVCLAAYFLIALNLPGRSDTGICGACCNFPQMHASSEEHLKAAQ